MKYTSGMSISLLLPLEYPESAPLNEGLLGLLEWLWPLPSGDSALEDMAE